MEEESLKSSIATYKTQLCQVEQAIQAAGETDDLVTLRRDLQELIQLSEESLLSLKKSQLLQQLGGEDVDNQQGGSGSTQAAPPSGDMDDEYAAFQATTQGVTWAEWVKYNQQGGSGSTQTETQSSDMDDEYAAFQAMLADDVSTSEPTRTVQDTNDTSRSTPEVPDITDSPPPPDLSQFSEMYKEIIGTKCRAPFVQEWGAKTYGNAMIAAVDVESEVEMPKVQVMFCNPTHSSMLPCQYFLEGNCKFTQENCRYSHGCQVALEDLQEYTEPDYSVVKLESCCLVHFDDIWYPATVLDLHDNNWLSVTFNFVLPWKLDTDNILLLSLASHSWVRVSFLVHLS